MFVELALHSKRRCQVGALLCSATVRYASQPFAFGTGRTLSTYFFDTEGAQRVQPGEKHEHGIHSELIESNWQGTFVFYSYGPLPKPIGVNYGVGTRARVSSEYDCLGSSFLSEYLMADSFSQWQARYR